MLCRRALSHISGPVPHVAEDRIVMERLAWNRRETRLAVNGAFVPSGRVGPDAERSAGGDGVLPGPGPHPLDLPDAVCARLPRHSALLLASAQYVRDVRKRVDVELGVNLDVRPVWVRTRGRPCRQDHDAPAFRRPVSVDRSSTVQDPSHTSTVAASRSSASDVGQVPDMSIEAIPVLMCGSGERLPYWTALSISDSPVRRPPPSAGPRCRRRAAPGRSRSCRTSRSAPTGCRPRGTRCSV
jgi:hypothetical protein